jgi:antitoxin HicB
MKTSTPTKGAEYYLGLNYPVTLRRLSSEEGGGYIAAIPQLGLHAFSAAGETREEALDALDEVREYLIPYLLERGEDLPEPDYSEEAIERYSGRILMRLPRKLHAQLAAEADRNDCSINQLATQLLAEGLERLRSRPQSRDMATESRRGAFGSRPKQGAPQVEGIGGTPLRGSQARALPVRDEGSLKQDIASAGWTEPEPQKTHYAKAA